MTSETAMKLIATWAFAHTYLGDFDYTRDEYLGAGFTPGLVKVSQRLAVEAQQAMGDTDQDDLPILEALAVYFKAQE